MMTVLEAYLAAEAEKERDQFRDERDEARRLLELARSEALEVSQRQRKSRDAIQAKLDKAVKLLKRCERCGNQKEIAAFLKKLGVGS
jgi:hypothetical protein